MLSLALLTCELRGNNRRQNEPASRVNRAERCIFHNTSSLLDGNITGVSLWRSLIPPTQRQALHNLQQIAAQLQEFIDAGCSGFRLSGYPHHVEAERVGGWPLLVK